MNYAYAMIDYAHMQCERERGVLVLQRGCKQGEAGRRWSNHTDNDIVGGCFEAGLRCLHSFEGCCGGDDEDSSQGAQRQWDHRQLCGSRSDSH